MAAKPYTNIWDVQTQAVHCLAVAVNSKSWLINLKKGGLNIWNHQKNKHLPFFSKGLMYIPIPKTAGCFWLGVVMGLAGHSALERPRRMLPDGSTKRMGHMDVDESWDGDEGHYIF